MDVVREVGGEELTFVKDNTPAGYRSLGRRVVYQLGGRISDVSTGPHVSRLRV